MTRRSPAQRLQARADLIAALHDSEQRPARVDELIAATHGLTVATFPDHAWAAAYADGWTDVLVLHRAGQLVVNPPSRATYAMVDFPGSPMARQLAEIDERWDDEAEVRRMLLRWQPAD